MSETLPADRRQLILRALAHIAELFIGDGARAIEQRFVVSFDVDDGAPVIVELIVRRRKLA